MKYFLGLCVAASLLLNTNATAGADAPPPPGTCEHCAEWNESVTPFRVYGDTYYVGVHGLASVLVGTSAGLILLDGDLAQSAPLIEANVRALGFQMNDIRLIANSHAHSDHAGGIFVLQRDSGAMVAASPSGAEALRLGHAVADDPQVGYTENTFPPVAGVQVVLDEETLRVGKVAITAHFTPGHTPGSTTWTWKSCEAGRCLDVVYADSLNAVSAPGFRFSGDQQHPDISAQFHNSILKVRQLPCDIILSVHPEQAGLWDKLAARQKGVRPDPFITPDGCKAYADGMMKRLEQRLGQEAAQK
jgi:metallo-beta-lactamase class B